MRWPLRRKPAGRRDRNQAVVRPDRTRIALLEHEVFGIAPAPGSAAAAALGAEELARQLREAKAVPRDRAQCPHEDVADVSQFDVERRLGLCLGCGAHAVEGDDGQWTFPGLDDPR